jgi:superfamily I DNA/RNA helicase
LTLVDHFEILSSEQEGRISQDNADAITLCSIHGAKGREWPIVFGVRFNEGD